MKTWSIQDITGDKDLNRVWRDINKIEIFKDLKAFRINLLIDGELRDCIVLRKDFLNENIYLDGDEPSTKETIIIADGFEYFMNVEELNGKNFDDTVLEDALKTHFEREVLIEQYNYYKDRFFSPSQIQNEEEREITSNTIKKIRNLLDKKNLNRYVLETGNKINDLIYLDCDLEKAELEAYISKVRDIVNNEDYKYLGLYDFEILLALFREEKVAYKEIELTTVSF